MTLTVVVLTFTSAILLVLYCFIEQNGGKTPPGPIGIPILGYLPFVGSKPHQILQKLSKIYGPIFSIRLGKQHIIVLNDPGIIEKALSLKTEREKSNYESNKMNIWTNCALYLQLPLCLDYLKIQIQNHFKKYMQDNTTGLAEVLNKHECLMDLNHIISQTNKNSIHLKIGQKTKYDSLIDIFEDKVFSKKRKTETKTGNQSFPSTLWKVIHYLSVGSGIQFTRNFKMVESIINFVVNQQQRNWDYGMIYEFVFILTTPIEGNESLLKNKTAQNLLLKLYDMNCQHQQTIAEWLLLIMATHSEIQKKVQEEIEAARLQWLSDRYFQTKRSDAICFYPENILYVEAVILELLRWRSPEPLTFLSVTGDDTMLEEYFIPRNSVLIANIWSIHHSSKYWGDNTEMYRPERFIAKKEDKTKNLFSSLEGRRRFQRRCVSDIFLNFVAILHKFNVSLPSGISPNMEGELFLGFLQPEKQDLILTLRN
ncbi:cytochrome P450 83B1 [Nephila pilipes]|uniref:Cytochrome P450 83B1 n=1 Tax=Nephila pilipes TaxID=299642 RepID=A0A8X6UPS9_NEPPI|nr:cytochrome P450 83B1 [Nephila pilipes]